MKRSASDRVPNRSMQLLVAHIVINSWINREAADRHLDAARVRQKALP